MGRGSRRGRATGSRPRSARRGRCGRSRVVARPRSRAPRPAPGRWRRSGSGPARRWMPSVCSRPRLAAWTLRALVSTVGISGERYTLPFDLPRLRDGFDGVDAGDHRGRDEGQLGGLAGEALAVGDGQEVRPEAFDLCQQPGLARGGQAEHGYDRGDPDRDPQRRERRAHPPGAQPHARDAREIGGAQPPRGEVRGGGSSRFGRRRRSSSHRSGCFVDERERRRSCVLGASP